MADSTKQQTRDSLLVAYNTLSPCEQEILQLVSVLYEPTTRTTIVKCLNRARIRDDGGHRITLSYLAMVFDRLQRLDLLDPLYRCHESVVESITRQAVYRGSFARLAETVRLELPVPGGHGKRSQLCWRTMREFRIDIYSKQFNNIDKLLDTLAPNCAVVINSRFPTVAVCANPFEPAWFCTLPASFQFFALDRIVSCSLHTLVHYPAVADFLSDGLTANGTPEDEQLPFHRLHVTYHLWRGDLAAVRRALLAHPDSFDGSGFGGCLEFLAGNSEAALAQFDVDLERLRQMTGKRKVYFYTISGLFCILALLRRNDPDSLARARLYLAMAKAHHRQGLLHTAYALVHCVLLAEANKVVEAESALRRIDPDDHAILLLLFAMVRYWLHGTVPDDLCQRLVLLADQARAEGFLWLAMECGELLYRVGWQEEDLAFDAQAAAIGKAHGLASMVNTVRLHAPWERRLQALIGITAVSPLMPAPGKRARLVWQVDDQPGGFVITPKEQRLTGAAGWSKGRPMALSRLYGEPQPDFLSEPDSRICASLIREYANNRTAYRFDMNRTLPALIGHPLLFLAEAPDTPVEFVKGEPELLVEETATNLRLRFSRPLVAEGVTVIRETPTCFKVIEVTEQHRRIADILGKVGLEVPASAEPRVMAAIANIASFMTVHSAISANGGSDSLPEIQEVEARARIHVHLLPLGAGIKLAMFVKPFGDDGPYLKPGTGEAHVMVEIRGQRQQTRRNLQQEVDNGRAVMESCPTLTLGEEAEWEWAMQEAADCLEVLLELREISDRVTVEWPEGERFSVSQPASLSQLRLRIRQRDNWFELNGELQIDEDRVLKMQQLLGLMRTSVGRFLPLGDGQFLVLTKEFRSRMDAIALLAEPDGNQHDPTLRIHPLAAFALEESLVGLAEVDDGWKAHVRTIKQARALRPTVPSTLQAELRDYQEEGYVWLARLAHLGVGACLADDMGLGKTLQALAIILARAGNGPTLVVAPTSVCLNWENEANRFAPTLTITQFGSKDRQAIIAGMGRFDVLVTSYTLLQQEAELLASVTWEIIVLDEAQAIKNMATKRSRAAMGLIGRFKLITTGTPIENHLGELWNLFHFITPGLLGSLARFNERFALPIERHQSSDARRTLKKLIQPFLLRRLKSQVLEELPPRTEITLQVTMSPEEAVFYEALRRQALETLDRPEKHPGHIQILAEIMRLRRACCNTRLVMPDSTIGSSKLALFGAMVEELLASRHKALVFSQFVGHLACIREYIEQQNITYCYLDGSTPARERARQVEEFQAGHGDLFLISLKAGGLGLSLTAADYVIHMDPWWNPAVEDQASDRAHRIGQQHPVTIYRLVMGNSIEEKIVKLHQQKRDLANSLLSGSDVSAKMSAMELLNLIREG